MSEENTNVEETFDMTIEERKEHEKIKRAVGESLLEIVGPLPRYENQNEPWGAKWLLDIVGKIIPVLVIALLSWVCLTIIDVQKDIVAIRWQVAQVEEHLVEHGEDSRNKTITMTAIHHVDSAHKCSGCHVQFKSPQEAESVRKKMKKN